MSAPSRVLYLAVLSAGIASIPAFATSTYTGNLAADNSYFETTLTLATTEDVMAYTTSYGGGANLDGTNTAAGGFGTELTLFSNATGQVAAFSNPDGTCSGSAMADGATGLCEDASLNAVLGAGTYQLFLTENPNVALGSLTDGFLAGSDPNFTGTTCGVTGGQFLDVGTAPCVQRTSAYALNVSLSPVPEPSTFLLIPSALLVLPFLRRKKSNHV